MAEFFFPVDTVKPLEGSKNKNNRNTSRKTGNTGRKNSDSNSTTNTLHFPTDRHPAGLASDVIWPGLFFRRLKEKCARGNDWIHTTDWSVGQERAHAQAFTRTETYFAKR